MLAMVSGPMRRVESGQLSHCSTAKGAEQFQTVGLPMGSEAGPLLLLKTCLPERRLQQRAGLAGLPHVNVPRALDDLQDDKRSLVEGAVGTHLSAPMPACASHTSHAPPCPAPQLQLALTATRSERHQPRYTLPCSPRPMSGPSVTSASSSGQSCKQRVGVGDYNLVTAR